MKIAKTFTILLLHLKTVGYQILKQSKIRKLDLSKKEYFGESYQNSIASIMKAKTQVIKKENKKAEVKSVKKDIITKVENEAESDVEQ